MQGHEISSQETRVLGAAHNKNFLILACAILIQLQSVTDRQMACKNLYTSLKTRKAFTECQPLLNATSILHAIAECFEHLSHGLGVRCSVRLSVTVCSLIKMEQATITKSSLCAVVHTSRVNCNEMAVDRLRQCANRNCRTSHELRSNFLFSLCLPDGDSKFGKGKKSTNPILDLDAATFCVILLTNQ